MEVLDYILILGVGLGAGFLNVVAGGGSLITLPILIFLGLPAPIANATNRVALFFQNIFAVSGFQSKGVSAYPYSIYVGLSAFVGAIFGALISVELDEKLFNKIIAIVMVAVIFLTIFNPNKKDTGDNEKMDRKHQIIGTIVFFFIGLYGGFIQAGVGFIIMAALTNINGLSLVKTNAIKVFVVLVYTTSALAIFIYNDMINWHYGITLAVGNSAGAWIASRWSVKAGDKWIKRLLIVAVTGLAIKLWFYT
jgi:uncharacterized membrane protein YfcA